MSSLKKNKFLICTILGLIFILSFTLYLRSQRPSNVKPFFSEDKFTSEVKSESFPIYANCEKAVQGNLNFSSRVYAHEDFYNYYQLNKYPEKAAIEQLKYLNGYFHFWENEKQTINPLNSIRVTIRNVSKVKYPFDIVYDVVTDDLNLYPPAFHSSQNLSRQHQGYEISYDAEVPIISCGEHSSNLVPVELPLDPYLAYWFVTKNERRVLRFNETSGAHNPCADEQIVDVKYPSMYWYVWKPLASKKNAYDCREILKNRVEKITAQLSLDTVTEKSVNFDEFQKLPTMKFKILLGLMSYKNAKEALDLGKSLLTNEIEVQRLLLASRKPNLDIETIKQIREQDPAVWSLINLKNQLTTIVNIKNAEFDFHKETIVYHVSGQLKKSSKPIEIEFEIIPTGHDVKIGSHFPYLWEALKNWPAVFYIGHASMGINLSFENMQKELGISPKNFIANLKTQPYQFFSVISCYSTSQFSTDYLRFRKDKNLTTDLLLLGAGGYAYPVPLSFLYYLDLKIAGLKPSLEKAMELFLQKKEIIFIQRQSI